MADTSGDPKISAYEAVRAHELMLNEAVSRLEHASLAPLIALNGGAVVAFLTLLGVLLGKDSERHPNLWLSGLAVGTWVVGLVAAALATTAATGQQRAISAAHRLLREELEAALIVNDQPVTDVLTGPDSTMTRPSVRDWTESVLHPIKWWTGRPDDEAAGAAGARPDAEAADAPKVNPAPAAKRPPDRNELRTIGSIYAKRLKARWWLSVTMFVTGAVLALVAIVFGSPVPKPTRNTTTTPRAAHVQLRDPGTTDLASPSGEYVMSCRCPFDEASAWTTTSSSARFSLLL